jgi:hypothetical protein
MVSGRGGGEQYKRRGSTLSNQSGQARLVQASIHTSGCSLRFIALLSMLVTVMRIRIRDLGWVKNQDPYPGSGSGMNIPDHISESLETIFWVKIFEFFDADAARDPGIFVIRFRIRDKHPGSATLVGKIRPYFYFFFLFVFFHNCIVVIVLHIDCC